MLADGIFSDSLDMNSFMVGAQDDEIEECFQALKKQDEEKVRTVFVSCLLGGTKMQQVLSPWTEKQDVYKTLTAHLLNERPFGFHSYLLMCGASDDNSPFFYLPKELITYIQITQLSLPFPDYKKFQAMFKLATPRIEPVFPKKSPAENIIEIKKSENHVSKGKCMSCTII
jgi:hypothetical protein